MSGCLAKPLSHPDCELDVLERAIERACGLVTAEDVQLDLDEPATARLLLDQQHRLAAETAATEPPVDLDVVEKPDRLPWEALSKPDASDGLARLGLLNDEQLLPCDGTPFPNEHREVALRLLVGFLLSHACIVDQADQVAVSGRGHERGELVIGNWAQTDRHAYFIQSRDELQQARSTVRGHAARELAAPLRQTAVQEPTPVWKGAGALGCKRSAAGGFRGGMRVHNRGRLITRRFAGSNPAPNWKGPENGTFCYSSSCGRHFSKKLPADSQAAPAGDDRGGGRHRLAWWSRRCP